MTKKQLCGGAALLLLGTAFALLKEQAPVNSFLSADEALSIFGGQAGSCYQNAPETCPSSTTPASCNTYPCATNYNITCNENGNMVTYTSCYCATSDYLFGQVNNPNYQSAVDMGQNAKNGNTGETQQPGKFCGSAQLCQQYSTCDNLCSACFIGASGTLVCNIQYSFNSVYPVYAPDPNTPACPQQIGLLRDPIPRSSFAVAWHNGAFLQLAN